MNIWLNLVLRTIILFSLLLFSTKLMGKREIGQLSVFDFLIVLCVADIMIIGIENYDRNIFYSIIPMAVVVLIQKTIAILSIRFLKIRTIMDGKETVIIKNGKILLTNMKKEKYNMNDLYTQLREKDVRSIEEVEYAILESNGRLSVFLKEEKQAFPLPLIVSGKVDYENLKILNKKESWLIKELAKENLKINDVYGCSFNNGNLEIVKIIE